MSASTTTSCPPRYRYLFRNILDFPHRILHPPNPSVPKVGNVRSLKLTPCYSVSLEDVINGRHLPPLGRKEFEEFLYFKEYSVENLYFYVWLAQYQRAYNDWDRSGPEGPSSQLAMSYARAKQTFFTPGSSWELNLPQRVLQDLLRPERPHPGPKSHPHPSALASVGFEVNTYLNDSLQRFIQQNSGNAGRLRGLFAVVVGLLTIGVGLVPIILSSLSKDASSWHIRLLRLSSIPALWLGFATFIMGLHGVCVVIFLFGDARQLYPYELCRPDISSPIINRRLADAAGSDRISAVPAIAAAAGSSVATAVASRGAGRAGRERISVLIESRDAKSTKPDFVQFPPQARRDRSATDISVDPATTKTADSSAADLNFEMYQVDRKDEHVIEAQTPSSVGHHTDENSTRKQSDEIQETQYAASTLSPTSTGPTSNYSSHLFPDSPVVFDFDSLPVPPNMPVPNWKSKSNSRDFGDCSPTSRSSMSEAFPGQPGQAPYSNKHTPIRSRDNNAQRSKQKIGNYGWSRDRTMFGPLTKVLDPVITRTQWEIATRSCFLALVLSIVVAASTLAIR